MPFNPNNNRLVAVILSVALHALVFALVGGHPFHLASQPDARKPEEKIVFMALVPPPAETRPPAAKPVPQPAIEVPPDNRATMPAADRPPASLDAPPAPTAEEWALAAKYTLKNSKRYRYNWGQQVRSMMGAALEGPDQGVVRFRVEIAPDGTLARLETLWTTSPVAEQLARKAIVSMAPLPPTPTGKPLVFEKTISFSPFATDGPPIYKNDCLADPPTFRNPFAWNGQSAPARSDPVPAEKQDPQAFEECLKQLPQDSIEAEGAHDQRLLDQWRSIRLGR